MINQITALINSLLLPTYCILCGKYGDLICQSCIKYRLNVNFRNVCHVCGNSTYLNNIHFECEDKTNLDNLIFFCDYNESVKKIVEDMKYKEFFAIADYLSKCLANQIKALRLINNLNSYVVTYVPSFWHKKFVRGFNQSEIMSKALSRTLNLEWEELLIKYKPTHKQAGSSRVDRALNLKSTFKLNGLLEFKKIIIVDDVHTTGATLNECAKVLKAAGAKEVIGVCFAKSLNYSHAAKSG